MCVGGFCLAEGTAACEDKIFKIYSSLLYWNQALARPKVLILLILFEPSAFYGGM